MFRILEHEETGATKYHALQVEIKSETSDAEIADCVVYEYFDANSTHSHFEIVSVEPEELEQVVMELEDEIIQEM